MSLTNEDLFAYNRYKEYADRMDEAFLNIDLLKKAAADHSEKFQKLA